MDHTIVNLQVWELLLLFLNRHLLAQSTWEYSYIEVTQSELFVSY